MQGQSSPEQSGVYFLFGVSDETGKGIVYIGQAGARKNGEGILNRLMEHKRNPEKDYWTEAIAFTTSNDSLGPTEICYLEHRFCSLAISANRYEVKNGNDPNPGNISEEKQSAMEDFIDYAKIIMGTLGHKVFEPISTQPMAHSENNTESSAESALLLRLERSVKNVGKLEAIGMRTTEGFVVLKGSHISPEDDDTISSVLKERRRSAKIDENGVLLEDELFSSPSYAAMFVVGKSENGLMRWKTEAGKTLKALESEESEND